MASTADVTVQGMKRSTHHRIPRDVARLWKEIEKLKAEAYERGKAEAWEEAFTRGWREATIAISRAAASVQLQNMPTVTVMPSKTNQPNAVARHTPSLKTKRVRSARAATSSPTIVLEAIKRQPGMSGIEVLSSVHIAGHMLEERTMRTALHRLKKRSLIVNREGKWFPASGEEAGAGTASGDAPAERELQR